MNILEAIGTHIFLRVHDHASRTLVIQTEPPDAIPCHPMPCIELLQKLKMTWPYLASGQFLNVDQHVPRLVFQHGQQLDQFLWAYSEITRGFGGHGQLNYIPLVGNIYIYIDISILILIYIYIHIHAHLYIFIIRCLICVNIRMMFHLWLL